VPRYRRNSTSKAESIMAESKETILGLLAEIKQDVKNIDQEVRGAPGEAGLKTRVTVIEATNKAVVSMGRIMLSILVPVSLLVLGLVGRMILGL
jgi:hypothetical protein